ncbi:FAA hydrolase family protein [Marinicauda algicola]|uniref:FAA hydrolase family protein n=1 Tax=Marinicauda algicola TaxID=2029849 RepID=A0A4S2GYH2_9PROT|nr:fumarylacetoacetate hydrolase family protein [Marinicauda algicola]TGY87931.1 FAA hydrolase family protein [Marinicauda algicola]
MTDLVFDAPEPVTLPVTDGRAFPVRRIYCVGRNYAEHAREMGSDPDREPPFFFTKPRDAVVTGERVAYPPATSDLHFEAELVLALKSGGANIAVADALDHVFGCAAGVDLTRRDLQAQAKKAGRPWDTAKGFDQSAPVGTIAPGLPDMSAAISLDLNAKTRQQARLSDMIWSPGEVVAHLSRLFRLEAGDLIFTGTPAGVGPLIRGDRVEMRIEGLPGLDFEMV